MAPVIAKGSMKGLAATISSFTRKSKIGLNNAFSASRAAPSAAFSPANPPVAQVWNRLT